MAKIKKFEIIRMPVEVEYQRPILGRAYAVYVWIKCIRLVKFNVCGYKFVRLFIPKYEVVTDEV